MTDKEALDRLNGINLSLDQKITIINILKEFSVQNICYITIENHRVQIDDFYDKVIDDPDMKIIDKELYDYIKNKYIVLFIKNNNNELVKYTFNTVEVFSYEELNNVIAIYFPNQNYATTKLLIADEYIFPFTINIFLSEDNKTITFDKMTYNCEYSIYEDDTKRTRRYIIKDDKLNKLNKYVETRNFIINGTTLGYMTSYNDFILTYRKTIGNFKDYIEITIKPTTKQ